MRSAATLLLGIPVCIALNGCALQNSVRNPSGIVVDGFAYSLVSERNAYFVGEPFRLALHVKNMADRKQELPAVLGVGYRLQIQGAGSRGDFRGSWSVQMLEEDRGLPAGDSRVIDLPRELEDCCLAPGSHQVRYCYFGTESSGGPRWRTPFITIECMEQPLVIPAGTDKRVKEALGKLRNAPGLGIETSRPGWTAVSYSEPMKELAALKHEAVPALLANIHVSALEMPIIQLLGDLRVKEAVPLLLDRLWMQDGAHDSLIIAKLADITQHPDGYRFHRRWFDERTQQAAVRAYREWWAKYRRENPDPAATGISEPKDALHNE